MNIEHRTSNIEFLPRRDLMCIPGTTHLIYTRNFHVKGQGSQVWARVEWKKRKQKII